MFLWPLGEKLIFLKFLGSDTQIKGEQNTVSIGMLVLLIGIRLWVLSLWERELCKL